VGWEMKYVASAAKVIHCYLIFCTAFVKYFKIKILKVIHFYLMSLTCRPFVIVYATVYLFSHRLQICVSMQMMILFWDISRWAV
jgi:hypothetical protein